ncbi:ATP-binding protein [Patulibacter minatonensis]|uniref:ATP-binding protein n=1 Tax=Patulibacter minatonensis TaxID=298163 RepID=UPI0004ACAD63|nr:ATP-binding protein [Patulibacter minatonensis]
MRPLPRSVPLRIRLTIAFASVIGIVLAGVGALIYVEFSGYIDQRADDELAERSVAFRGLAAEEVRPRRIVALSGEAYAQIYDARGRLLASSRGPGRTRLLSADQLARARRAPVVETVPKAPGAQDGVRLRAFTIDETEVAVVAEPRDDRDRELDKLATLLLVSLPGALILSSLAGYVVAGAALAPVERLRSRAAEISDTDLGDRLPRPGTGDELDRLAETLNSMLGRLQGALEHERQIVGDASHELRTPIAVLRTRVDVALRDRTLGTEDLRATLEAVHQDAVRLTRLADDLLLLARADQGALPLRLEPIDVEDLLDGTAARHRGPAPASADDRAIRVAPPEGGAVLLGDPDRMAQVLDNLVVNALRHGRGAIELSAGDGPDAGTIRIAVADEGPGFPADFAGRAFDRFSQADGSPGGSGLGLAIVAAIVRAHGGSVAVEDGARVVAVLPRA